MATTLEVRRWARDNGYAVGVRGHLPQDVISAFHRANPQKFFPNGNPQPRGSTKKVRR